MEFCFSRDFDGIYFQWIYGHITDGCFIIDRSPRTLFIIIDRIMSVFRNFHPQSINNKIDFIKKINLIYKYFSIQIYIYNVRKINFLKFMNSNDQDMWPPKQNREVHGPHP